MAETARIGMTNNLESSHVTKDSLTELYELLGDICAERELFTEALIDYEQVCGYISTHKLKRPLRSLKYWHFINPLSTKVHCLRVHCIVFHTGAYHSDGAGGARPALGGRDSLQGGKHNGDPGPRRRGPRAHPRSRQDHFQAYQGGTVLSSFNPVLVLFPTAPCQAPVATCPFEFERNCCGPHFLYTRVSFSKAT